MPKTKDTAYLQVSARIRSLERFMLNRERMERMLEARNEEDAVKVLSECAYSGLDDGWEASVARERVELYEKLLVADPNHTVVNFFRAQYDCHNLKVLIKTEASGASADRLLIHAGSVPVKTLVDEFRQGDVRCLGKRMHKAVAEARDLLARTRDAQATDLLMDRACLSVQRTLAEESGSDFLQETVALRYDVYNLRAAVRVLRMGKPVEFLQNINLLRVGGRLQRSRLSAAIMEGAPLEELYPANMSEVAAAAEKVIRGEAELTAFERLCDNVLLAQLRKAKFIAFGEQPLVAYIAAKESEFTAIRIILSGRDSGASSDEIRARLRDVV